MKNLFAGLVLSFFALDAFADDWRMRKFDLDADGYITLAELKLQCKVNEGLFEHADKNGDEKLNKLEARKATWLLFKGNKCPQEMAIPRPEGIRG